MPDLDEDIRELRGIVQEHGEQIATLSQQMQQATTTLTRATDTLEAHTARLTEYAAAQKFIHWLITVVLAVAGWFVGMKSGKSP